jgi:hypothetical protein
MTTGIGRPLSLVACAAATLLAAGAGTAFAQFPPLLAEQFGAASLPIGGSTTLTFFIVNQNSSGSSFFTNLAFTDTLPNGLVISAPNNLTQGCPGSVTVTAAPGTTGISFSGGFLPAPSSCFIGTLAVWLLNGLQALQQQPIGMLPANWIVAETGDFNSDGRSDILFRDTNTGMVAIWFMNGTQVSSTQAIATITTDWNIQGLNAD